MGDTWCGGERISMNGRNLLPFLLYFYLPDIYFFRQKTEDSALKKLNVTWEEISTS